MDKKTDDFLNKEIHFEKTVPKEVMAAYKANFEKEYRKILAKNIKRIAYENHKTQADIVRDLGLKQTTVSTWMSGTRMPRMEHIDMLCAYFNCTRADIMNDSTDTTPEKALLSLFRKLNDVGKEVAIERLAELCQLSRYTEVSG